MTREPKVRHFLVVILLTALCVAAAVAGVPSELSDTEFWRIVSTFSEDGGGFLSENFVSNELGYPYIMSDLVAKARRGGVYLGVGPEQNFTYIAAVRPSLAFVVDIRRQNMIEHLLYKALFETAESRVDFMTKLFARKPLVIVKPDADTDTLFAAFNGAERSEELYRQTLDDVKKRLVQRHGFGLSKDDEASLQHVYDAFVKEGPDVRYSVIASRMPVQVVAPQPAGGGDSPLILNPVPAPAPPPLDFPSYAAVMKTRAPQGKQWSYLANEASYRAVRDMQIRNLIVPVVGDFAGPKALREVGRYIKKQDARVAVFYVSNVEQYLTPLPKLLSFYQNVKELPLDGSSTFVRSAQLTGLQPGLAQSSINAMQPVTEAVLDGRAQNWADVFFFGIVPELPLVPPPPAK